MLIFAAAVALACADPMAFGAVPNDGQPDDVAFQAAIDSALVGSHEVCIPSGEWTITKRARASLLINGGPLRMYGTGPSTVLRMTGDGGHGDWYGLEIRNAHDVELRDFTFDAVATFNTEEQTHIIQVAFGAHDVVLTNLVLGPMRRADQPVGAGAGGDCIRLLGEIDSPVERITITQSQLLNCDRSGIALQRGVRHVEISHLDILGTGDSPIDFEPTAPGPISYITMADLFIDRPADAQGAASIAIAGYGADVADHIVVKDSILQGGGISVLNASNVDILDNDIAQGPGTGATIRMHRRASNVMITRNTIIRRANNEAGPLISATHNNGLAPNGVRVVNNQMRQETSAPVIELQSMTNFEMTKNAVQYAGDDGTQPMVWARSVIADVGGITIRDNNLRGKSGALMWVSARDRAVGRIDILNNTAADVGATLRCEVNDKAMHARIKLSKNRVGKATRVCGP